MYHNILCKKAIISRHHLQFPTAEENIDLLKVCKIKQTAAAMNSLTAIVAPLKWNCNFLAYLDEKRANICWLFFLSAVLTEGSAQIEKTNILSAAVSCHKCAGLPPQARLVLDISPTSCRLYSHVPWHSVWLAQGPTGSEAQCAGGELTKFWTYSCCGHMASIMKPI